MIDFILEQFDNVRVGEVMLCYVEGADGSAASIVVCFVCEGWKLKRPFEDVVCEICLNVLLAGIQETVRLGIEYGNSLPPKPVRLPVPEYLASAMSVGIKGSKIRLTYATEDEAKAAFNELDRMLGLGGPV